MFSTPKPGPMIDACFRVEREAAPAELLDGMEWAKESQACFANGSVFGCRAERLTRGRNLDV